MNGRWIFLVTPMSVPPEFRGRNFLILTSPKYATAFQNFPNQSFFLVFSPYPICPRPDRTNLDLVPNRPTRLFLSHGRSEVSKRLAPLVLSILDHARIRVAREGARPLDKGGAFVLAGRDGEEADRAEDRRVADVGRGRDDRVCYVMVDGLEEERNELARGDGTPRVHMT